jgi:hypothetical protein
VPTRLGLDLAMSGLDVGTSAETTWGNKHKTLRPKWISINRAGVASVNCV